jgi:hypothetical protein
MLPSNNGSGLIATAKSDVEKSVEMLIVKVDE